MVWYFDKEPSPCIFNTNFVVSQVSKMSNILIPPMQGSGSCVEMMNDPDHPGDWNDVDCNNMNAYLCQQPLGKGDII